MRSGRAGFTLIEVVVALAIMLVIGTLTWSTMAGTLQMRDIMEDQDATARSARVALDRIARELEVAFLTENTGAVNTYQTVFVGKDESDVDMLWFATLTHQRRYANSRECDQTEITVWGEQDPDHPGEMVLLHREAPRIDQEPDQDGAIAPLARRVSRFELRYMDPESAEWTDEWDSTGIEQTGRLPRAVQIVLGLNAPDPEDDDEESVVERLYVRTVMLETADQIEKSLLNSNSGSSGGGLAGAIQRGG